MSLAVVLTLLAFVGVSLVLPELLPLSSVLAHNEKRAGGDLERGRFWLLARQKIAERPVFGHGAGLFFELSTARRGDQAALTGALATAAPEAASAPPPKAAPPSHAHNLFLQLWVELGLVGLALYLLCVGLAIISALRIEGEVGLPLIAGVLALLVQSLFDHPLFSVSVSFYLWFTLGVLRKFGHSEFVDADPDLGLPRG